MTYLFVVIALPVMNLGPDDRTSLDGADGSNAIVLAVLFWLEQEWGFHYESAKAIRYERIELIRPENHALLLADLHERTGLPIKRFTIGRINFLNDSAGFVVYYDEAKKPRSLDEDVALAMNED